MNSFTELITAAKGLLPVCCANGLLAAACGAGVALAVAGWATVVAGGGRMLWKGTDAEVIGVNWFGVYYCYY